MTRHRLCILSIALAALGALAFAPMTGAQVSSDQAVQAQQRYEREIASCNTGTLAAPEREACVRAAGQRLDRERGMPSADVPVATPDGRATVIVPPGTAAPGALPETGTSRDGRATVVR